MTTDPRFFLEFWLSYALYLQVNGHTSPPPFSDKGKAIGFPRFLIIGGKD